MGVLCIWDIGYRHAVCPAVEIVLETQAVEKKARAGGENAIAWADVTGGGGWW
jgi:hypothetical protein